MNSFTKIDNIIEDSIIKRGKSKLKWVLGSSNRNIQQYQSRLNIDGTKDRFLFFLLTKRKIRTGINIYLEIYVSTKLKRPDHYYFNDELLKKLSKYKMTNIGTYYLTRYVRLLKLYGIIKYQNYLFYKNGVRGFVNDLKKWTEDGLLVWFRDNNGYTCYDVRHNKDEIFLNLKKRTFINKTKKEDRYVYNLYIYLNGNNFTWFQINDIGVDEDLYEKVLNSIPR